MLNTRSLDWLLNKSTQSIYPGTNPWTGVPLQKGQKKIRKGNHPSNLQPPKKRKKKK